MSEITAKAKLRDLGFTAQAVMDDAKMTMAEKAQALDLIDVDIKSANDELALHRRMRAMVDGGTDAEAGQAEQATTVKSIGRQVVESENYKTFVRNGLTGSASVEVKAAATIDEGAMGTFVGGGGMAGTLATRLELPGIVPLRFQPLYVADLFAQGTTDAPAVTYVVESAFNDNTAAVAEKGQKPQLDLTLARRQDNVSKIANISKVTDEMVQDVPQFQAYLTNRMIFGVKRAEETQVLNGNGTSPNLQGVLNRTGLAAPIATSASLTAAKAVNGIFNMITALRATSFVEPDAIVMNPTDWQTIRLGTDANGQYYAGGPFTGAYGNGGFANVEAIWGKRVVVTTAISQGKVLVGGFAECGQVFRRTGITVEMTNSNVNDFEYNLITLRAEERLALAIYRPSGFGVLTLTA